MTSGINVANNSVNTFKIVTDSIVNVLYSCFTYHTTLPRFIQITSDI